MSFKGWTVFASLTVVLFTSPLNAHYFEFCRLNVSVVSPPEFDGPHSVFKVMVHSASPARCGEVRSEFDGCAAEYVGQELEISLNFNESDSPKWSDTLTLIKRVWTDESVQGGRFLTAYELPGRCE